MAPISTQEQINARLPSRKGKKKLKEDICEVVGVFNESPTLNHFMSEHQPWTCLLGIR